MEAGPDLDTRLTHAFRRVLCRKPTDHNLEILRRAYRTQFAIFKANINDARTFTRMGSTQTGESLDVAEHAALSAVCLAILNLDEALTRE